MKKNHHEVYRSTVLYYSNYCDDCDCECDCQSHDKAEFDLTAESVQPAAGGSLSDKVTGTTAIIFALLLLYYTGSSRISFFKKFEIDWTN